MTTTANDPSPGTSDKAACANAGKHLLTRQHSWIDCPVGGKDPWLPVRRALGSIPFSAEALNHLEKVHDHDSLVAVLQELAGRLREHVAEADNQALELRTIRAEHRAAGSLLRRLAEAVDQ